MNKKVDEEFKYIHDEYILQCTCTEMKDKINNLQSKIDKAIELKHNWQNIKENATIVFDNNSLIEFMNNLENILKEDK